MAGSAKNVSSAENDDRDSLSSVVTKNKNASKVSKNSVVSQK